MIIVLFFLIMSPSGGLAFLAASIICTAGISLVVYVPTAYVLGHLFFKLWDRYVKQEYGIKFVDVDNNQKALHDYINKAREAGMIDSSIKDTLRSQGGWSDDEIDDAYLHDFFSIGKYSK